MRTYSFRRSLWIAVLAVQGVASAVAAGQTWAPDRGAVRGWVRDPAGLPIRGAKVCLVATAGDARRQLTTGAEGRFEFEDVAPGDYALEVEAERFQTYRTELEVRPGGLRVVDIRLAIASMHTAITVREQADDLRRRVEWDYEASKSVTSLAGEILTSNNPVSNYDALRYLPGVMNADFGGRDRFSTPTHIRGAAAWGRVETLDDYPAVDITPVFAEDGGYTASFSSVVPSVAVQDLMLSTGGLGVSYGQASGGVVRSFLKRGVPGKPHGNLRVEGVGIGEAVVMGDLAGGLRKLDYYISGQAVRGEYGNAYDTYARPIQDLRLVSGLAKVGYNRSPKERFEVLFLGGDENHGYFQNQFLAAQNRQIRRDFHTEKSNYFLAGRYDRRAGERLLFGAGLTHNRFHENRIEDKADGVPVGLSRRNRPQRATTAFGNISWQTSPGRSVSYTGETGGLLHRDQFSDITGAPIRFLFGEQAAYLRNSLVWDRGLTWNGGVRLSRIDNGFRNFRQNAYDVGLSYRLPTRTSLRASYSTGYKLNKAFYLWWGGGSFIRRAPAEGLRPSTTRTWEVGAEQAMAWGGASGRVRVSYFKTDELGLFNFGDSGTGVPFTDDARIKGFELWTEWHSRRVRPFASFTYLDNYRTSSTNPAARNIDLRFVSVPNKAAAAGSHFGLTKRLSLVVLGYYDGGALVEQIVNDNVVVTRFSSYVKVNAMASYMLGERFSFLLRAENLLNRRDLGYSRNIFQMDGSSAHVAGVQRDPGLIMAGGVAIRF
ncbi:MAG TPA: TonB-dependent receptor [Bryobacteraceae bacterium]|nr:TonB-dependent receptor [Bryobacteraceae bacterium]